MKWDTLIFFPFVGFIQWPLAALIPAAFLSIAFWFRRRRLVITPLLWILSTAAAVQILRRPRGAP